MIPYIVKVRSVLIRKVRPLIDKSKLATKFALLLSYFNRGISDMRHGSATMFREATRSSGKSFIDFEGIQRNTGWDEPVFAGARRVKNLFPNSELTVTKQGFAIYGVGFEPLRVVDADGKKWVRIEREFSTGFEGAKVTISNLFAGAQVRVSFKARSVGPIIEDTLTYAIVGTDLSALTNMSITEESQRYALPVATLTGVSCEIDLFSTGGPVGAMFEISEFMVEEVTRQDNQNPSEYVPTRAPTGASILSHFDENGSRLAGDHVLTNLGNRRYRIDAVSTLSQFRFRIPLEYLTPFRPYGVKITVLSNTVPDASASVDWSDLDVTYIFAGDTGEYLSAGGGRRYDSTYRFFDITLPNTTTGSIEFTVDYVCPFDHGTNSLDSKYFNYLNGNTVDGSNRVIEAKGAPISTKGIAFDPAGTNLCLYSGDMTNAVWVSGTTTAAWNGYVAGMSVYKITELASIAYHARQQSISTFADNTDVIVSGFVSLDISADRMVELRASTKVPNYPGIRFDTVNEAIVNSVGTLSSGFHRVKGGWRIWFRFNTEVGANVPAVYWQIYNSALSNSNYLGDGVSYITVGGVNAVHANQLSAYIPTTSSIVTRAEDTIYIDWPADLVNDFCICFKWTPLSINPSAIIIFGIDSSASDRAWVEHTGTNLSVRKVVGGVTYSSYGAMPLVIDNTYDVRVRFSSIYGVTWWVDGVKCTVETTNTDDLTSNVRGRIGGSLLTSVYNAAGAFRDIKVIEGHLVDSEVLEL